MTQPRADRLDVYYGDERVGAIHDGATLAFEYSPGWLGRSQPMSLAAIELQPGRQTTPAMLAFFENLLPEGELREYLVAQRKASTLFSLLLEVAGDRVGAFVLLPPGQTPEPPVYEATTWEAIAEALENGSAMAIDLQGQEARISLAGAQDKTSIALFDDGIPRLPKGTAPSTHILKPNIKRLAKVWHSAANEAIAMRAAAHCGLPTQKSSTKNIPELVSCGASIPDAAGGADGAESSRRDRTGRWRDRPGTGSFGPSDGRSVGPGGQVVDQASRSADRARTEFQARADQAGFMSR